MITTCHLCGKLLPHKLPIDAVEVTCFDCCNPKPSKEVLVQLKEFGEKFRQLLLEAEKAGHTIDDIAYVAESVIEADWDSPVSDEMIPEPEKP